MKKNAQLHLALTTELLEMLKKQAHDNNITISDLCRKKLRQNSKLDNMERMLEILIKKVN